MANSPLPLPPDAWGDARASNGLILQADTLVGGKYRLIRPAGFGGMGVVWVARNEATNAEVAVKVLLADRKEVDGEAVARFRREAHAAAQLYHRGIVRIFDLVELTGDDEGTLVMVMELLRGETLATLIDKRRKFSLDESLSIMLPLLSALAHAHAAGIVHRDLKPENVFLAVDPDGHIIPKILDFGISKLTHPLVPRITTDGAMLGTPSYMSPEQARGSSDVDARSDVFAAGIVLYEMLAGQSPFANASYHSVVAAILERDPPPLTNVPPEVWRVIKRALDKVPQIRFADASDLASALRDAAARAGAGAPEASGPYPATRPPSIADRSVPPAPFREPELTIPSMRARARRRARVSAVVAVSLASALLVALGLAAHATRAAKEETSRVENAPRVAATIAQPPAPVVTTAAPVSPAPPPVTAIANAVASMPAPTVAPTAPHASRPPPRAAAKPPPPTPPPAPVVTAPPPPPAKASPVVRDPGF